MFPRRWRPDCLKQAIRTRLPLHLMLDEYLSHATVEFEHRYLVDLHIPASQLCDRGGKTIGHNVNVLTSLHRNKTAEEMVDQIVFI